jgi:hypothetical protein
VQAGFVDVVSGGIRVPDWVVVRVGVKIETQRIGSVALVGVLGQESAGRGVVMAGLEII